MGSYLNDYLAMNKLVLTSIQASNDAGGLVSKITYLKKTKQKVINKI